MRTTQATAPRVAAGRGTVFVVLAVCALALGCKSSDDAPTAPPEVVTPGEGGAAGAGPDNGAGATAEPQGGNTGLGEGGDVNMPGAGGEATEPGSWDESFWDKAVWQ